MSDISAEYEEAEGLDNELLSEEDAMLADPAPYEAEVASENPAVAAEALDANVALEDDTQANFDDDLASEEGVDAAITGDYGAAIDVDEGLLNNN